MANAAFAPRTNLLLGSFPEHARDQLLRHHDAVSLQRNEVLYELGQPIEYVHFPVKGCIVSLIEVLSDGKSCDVELAGYEGLVGLEPLLGIAEAQFRAKVRVGGDAVRIRSDSLRAEIRGNGKLSEALEQYLQFVLTVFSQIAGCYRFHSLERHFCSRLLVMHDRIQADELQITHDVFAKMFGVRRVGITQAAQKLQRAGLIRYRWGKLTILDRDGLEGHACVCYRQMTQAYQQLLDEAWPYR